MNKYLLLPFLLLSLTSLDAQEKVSGTRKQLVEEIISLRKELSSLQALIDQNNIPLFDTLSTNDTLNYSNPFSNYSTFTGEIDIPLNTDSLLSIFYLQRSLHHNIQDDFLDIDSINVVADLPDSVYISRLKALNSLITLPYDPVVRSRIVYYTQKMPDKIPTILGLATYYMPIFEEIFDQHDMPLELKAMAIIESALNPTAVSRAKARGMWQFMHKTGLSYGLTINSYVDERYDPIVSGHAAARYLQDAYTVFGDWALAISAYNCGEGNVSKAIRRAGGSRAFWDIYPYLPRETRGYVPAFVAALYTLTYYKEHGIKPLRIEMPAHLDTLHVSQKVHFEQIAEFTGISVDELRDLNSQYIRDVIPGRPYILRLPHQYTSLFVDNERDIYNFKESTYFNPVLLAQNTSSTVSNRNQLVHTVKSGETLGGIAQRYRVKSSDLQYWNNIKGTLIRPGQKLMVYSAQAPSSTPAPKVSSSTSSTSSSSSTSNTATYNPNATYQWHTIKKGETLWQIAQDYKVSLNDLMALNGLNKNSKIIIGKQLRIKVL